jgi:hypothetical protein
MKKLAIFIMVFALLMPLFAFNVSAAENVIYIKDGGQGDGSSPENAMGLGDSGEAWRDAALYQAWEELKETGGTIVICGPYTLKKAEAKRTVGAPDIIMDGWYRNPDVTITYTSVYGGVDYRATAGAKLLFDDNNTALTFPTATVLKDITVVAGGCPSGDNRDNYLCAAYQPLTLGQGTNFVANEAGELPVVLGGHRNYSGIAAADGDAKITVDIGNSNTIGAIYGNLAYANKNQYGSSYITVKSGKVNGIYGDNQNNHGYGLSGSINITIEGGIICGEVAATNGGIPVNAFDNPVTPTVNIKVSGGDFTNCTGIKTTSQFFDDNVAGKNAAVQAPASITIDCTAAPWTTYDQVVAKTTQTVTQPTNPRPSEGGNEGGNEGGSDNPSTGDVIAIVLATMAASGLGVVVLKKKEF